MDNNEVKQRVVKDALVCLVLNLGVMFKANVKIFCNGGA
jgi:hypothetical protein